MNTEQAKSEHKYEHTVNTRLAGKTRESEHKVNTAGKVHKTLRIERDLAERVEARGIEGESATATYCRVLEAGVKALETAQDGGQADEGTQTAGDASQALITSLQSHIDTLKGANAELSAQLAIKDKQIEALSVLTAQAQQNTTKMLDVPQSEHSENTQDTGEEKRGFWARVFG